MILDRLTHAAAYRPLGPGIAAALDWLTRTDLAALPVGRHAVDGDALFFIVERYQPRPLDAAIWESHRRYIDVQCVIHGVERMGITPLSSNPPVKEPYDETKDRTFYHGAGDLITVPAGSFAIFSPQDIHAPGLAPEKDVREVMKVVMKVRARQGGACGY